MTVRHWNQQLVRSRKWGNIISCQLFRVVEYIHDAFDTFEHDGTFFLDVKKVLLTQLGTLNLSIKWLILSSPLHKFSLSFLTFATKHSPFELTIRTPLAHKSCWRPSGVKAGTLVIQNLYSWHVYRSIYLIGKMHGRQCYHGALQEH